MPHYTIRADVTASVEITFEAASEDEARQIFNDQIMVTAGLSDTPADKYDVADDSITEMSELTIEAD